MRNLTAKLTGISIGQLITPSNWRRLWRHDRTEPVALTLAKMTGSPVRMQMSREDPFKATGPTSGSSMKVKIGEERWPMVAAEAILAYQAGAFPGSPVMNGCVCVCPYDIGINAPLATSSQPPGGNYRKLARPSPRLPWRVRSTSSPRRSAWTRSSSAR